MTNNLAVGDRAKAIPSQPAGLARVPVDLYLMYAHRDEVVLTKAQAQEWRAARAIGVAMRRGEAFG